MHSVSMRTVPFDTLRVRHQFLGRLTKMHNRKGVSMQYVSIMGDSISTYKGFQPQGYSVFYDDSNLFRNGMTSVYDTWWAKVNQFLQAWLCVNNSFSGSRVTGGCFPSADCDERTALLHTDLCSPDWILIYMGFNDFGNGIPITSDRSDSPSFFASYYNMLMKIRKHYPRSRIVCGTLMEASLRDYDSWKFPQKWAGISICEYNAAIKIAAQLSGAAVADLASLHMRYETLDGTHPTKAGHDTMAQAWIRCLKGLGIQGVNENRPL